MSTFEEPIRPKGTLVMLAGDSRMKDNCRTFVFKGETHTLGNALKNAILRNPQVIFCGYSMPHPAEDQMLLRIQTIEGYSAVEALQKGLEDLKTMCDVTMDKFQEAMNEYNSNHHVKVKREK